MRASCLGLLLLAASTLACGSGSSPVGAKGSSQSSAAGDHFDGNSQLRSNALSAASLDLRAPQEFLHASDCRVDFYDEAGQLKQSFREEEISDGSAQFSLKVIETLIPMDLGWQNSKRVWEGSSFRYGSFMVRDASLVDQNFAILRGAQDRVIAGRASEHYLVNPYVSGNFSYQIWIDGLSGLALRAERYNSNGVLLFSREYETLNESPDLSLAVWFQGVHGEIELDLLQPLGDQLGLPVYLPKLLPPGFELLSAYKLKETDDDWVKLVYTDGIEPLFMLQRPAPPRTNPGTTGGKLDDPESKAVGPDLDQRLVIMDLDGVAGVHTQQREGTFEIVGTCDEQMLVDMLISALPEN